MPPSQPLLEVDAIDVHFGRRRNRRHVIHGASFTVAAGEVVGLIGESGSGKSTIARSILGLVDVAAGRIRIDGTDTTRLSGARRRTLRRQGAVQYVFQDPLRSLDADVPIGQSIAEPLRIRGGLSRAEIRSAVLAVAERTRVDETLLDRFPSEISGGQRQRAAIARALITQPRLLILDEPVSALDAANRVAVLGGLADLRDEGVGLLYISHDLGSVAGVTDRTLVLYQGEIVESGPTAELVNNPQHPYTRLLIGSAPTLAGPMLDRERRRELRAALAG